MKSVLIALLLSIAGMADAAPYSCPPPLGNSQAGCTFRSPGGTTTFTAVVSAQITGSAELGSAVALYMSLDALPCNSNAANNVQFVGAASNAAVVVGTCTFEVTSKRPADLVAVAMNYNATPAYMTLTANSIAFVPDFRLDVAVVGGGTVTATDGSIDCGAGCSHSYPPGTAVTLQANAAAGSIFRGWSGDCSGSSPGCTLAMNATRGVTANFGPADPAPVVEFHNAVSDHYFITADAAEAAAIDLGAAGPGWSRTGLSFRPGGNVAVCRFYGSTAPGPNSHFYTALADECDALKQLAAKTPAAQPRWNFEGLAFATSLPAGGRCPVGTVPVYRAYNNGLLLARESNHRFTTDPNALQEVVGRGWKYEGIAMCAPE